MPRSPKRLLVLNAGSSSLKFALFKGRRLRQRGQVEQIRSAHQLQSAVNGVLQQVESTWGRPNLVAHRVVHGGGKFWKPTHLTSAVVQQLRKVEVIAPLHLPANLTGISTTQRRWRNIPQWAVFDTGLYHDLPAAARWYSIPMAVATKYRIRKYGFHGISHAAAWTTACRQSGFLVSHTSGVSIHLGAGDSITSWRNGRPVDTSMGFTPLEGLTMATRSGDLDPFIPLFLQTQGWSVKRVSQMLQQQAGLYGLTGLRDIRDVLAAAGHPVPGRPRRRWSAAQRRNSRFAVAMFIYDIQRYLASYLGLLPDPKLIVFTGAVGQNAWVRAEVLRGVSAARGRKIVVVPADEEAAIAAAVSGVIH